MRVHIEPSQVPHDIALTAINEGKSYSDRCKYARRSRDNPKEHYIQRECAMFWISLSGNTAHKNFRRFNDPGDPSPTAIEILAGSIEIAEYMRSHVDECDNVTD